MIFCSTPKEDIHVKVVEQPQSRGYCFWYRNDPKISIKGVLSTTVTPTHPAIKICEGIGHGALLMVSCVTKTAPHRAHPCMLLGTNCEDGVYFSRIRCSSNETVIRFPKLCIQAHQEQLVSMERVLRKRRLLGADPFECGFAHINYAKSFIDLNAVRLCFEVGIKNENNLYDIPLPPIVSDIIYNSKIEDSKFSINIVKISDTQCLVDGGSKDIFVVCDNVIDTETQVYFFEVAADGQIAWQAHPAVSDVHITGTAMWFKPPKYRSVNVRQPACVLIQLRGKNDSCCSEAMPFQYLPLFSNRPVLKRKSLGSPVPSTSNAILQSA